MSFHFLWTQWLVLLNQLTEFIRGLLGKLQPTDRLRSPLSLTSTQWNSDKDKFLSGPIRISRLDPAGILPYPPTEQQVEDDIQKFFLSIDKAAVCDLASRYNGGKSCRIVDQRNGSFNICFFVIFDVENVTWILRIPIHPVVNNAWAKVVSEVRTLKYIKTNTTIPCPRIYAYGKDTSLVKDMSTPFMLMEFIRGQQLHTRTFLNAAESQRQNLYADLIDIFAQLRKLEFSVAGSLMPDPDNPDDESESILGPLLSMAFNEFERKSQKPMSTSGVRSVGQFVNFHYRTLVETFRLPAENLGRRQARMEIFALESVLEEIHRHINLENSNNAFILAHPDLRCGNIIVDGDFHILGVVDWEFAGTIPHQFFLPPPWIIGNDPDTLFITTGIPRDQVLHEFGAVLQSMRNTSADVARLWPDWQCREQNSVRNTKSFLQISPLIRILQNPPSLMDLYYTFIFPDSNGSETNRDDVVDLFFEKNPSFAEQVEIQLRNSERYTGYLRDKGLLISDEKSLEIQKFLERAKAVLQATKPKYDKETE
ncbi:phosphotransferase enzyme family protein, partial [Metarhizium majus ARSEF 297]